MKHALLTRKAGLYLQAKFLMPLAILVLATTASFGQNTFPTSGAAGIGTTAPNVSAALDITSNTKGLLAPRMTTAQKRAIISPATGLMVYQTDSVTGFYYYTGSAWWPVKHIIAGAGIALSGDTIKNTSPESSGWGLSGNAGTTSANFIGTTDAQPLRFKAGNFPAGSLNLQLLNAAFGTNSLSLTTNGSYNTAVGAYALYQSTTGSGNTAIGEGALNYTTGSNNTSIGKSSSYYNTAGYSNIAIGTNAFQASTVDHNVIAIGDSALYHINNTVGGSYNTAIGSKALYTETGTVAGYNTAVGFHTLMANINGTRSTAIGDFALVANTTGSNNTATGDYALGTNNTGGANTAMGVFALDLNTSGSNNTANGYKALYANTTATNNTATGFFALSNNTTAGDNTANGYQALSSNTTGTPNDAFGYIALNANQTGGQNAAFGAYSLQFSTQSYNTGIGVGALSQIKSGSTNTGLGYNAGQALTSGSGNIAIGASVQLPNATGSNQLNIGNWIYGSGGNISIGTKNVIQQFTVYNGISIDDASANPGNSVKNALSFGSSPTGQSGEGIASNRSNTAAGSNQYGIDFYTDFTRRMYVSNAGNVGFANSVSIGTQAINQQLTINEGMNIDEALGNPGNSLKNGLTFGSSPTGQGGEGIASNRSNTAAGTNQYGLDFYTDFTNRVSITNNGNVGIGTANPGNKLDVCGTIRAKEVLVQTGWCDYVFDKDYKLRPLADVQQFIELNKHLPDVPAASQIESSGVAVAQMDSIMIKKIEELTLYLVQQNQQITLLQQKVETLEKQNADLKKEDH